MCDLRTTLWLIPCQDWAMISTRKCLYGTIIGSACAAGNQSCIIVLLTHEPVSRLMVSTNAARCYISGLSTVELERKCDLYKSRSVSASTMKARVGQWECYLRFCHKYSISPYPCTPHRAALYASHLATYMVYTSICNYLHAVIFYHKLHGHPPPVLRDSELKMTLQGIRRAESRVKNVKSPIFPQHLRAMGGGWSQS